MSEPARATQGPDGLLGFLLRLFSSIWLGVTLLSLLFIYCSVGSSGVPVGPGMLEYPFLLNAHAWVSVRELLELSEFEWFHWWPFDVLIALICINLIVATLRRIPLNILNLGVWMIHSGILILAAGSVWYFSTKIEGDAPVARRQIVIEVPGAEPVRMTAVPGNRTTVGANTAAPWTFQVSSITPDWEILSGDDRGKRTYKVSVLVQGPEQMFIRELLVGYPQYTEDLIRSSDPQQPFARAKKELGTPLVDEALQLSLAYEPQEYFYVVHSSALYIREVGQREWIERPVRNLPRFKDHVTSLDRVWTSPGDELPPPRPLQIDVPPVPGDPLPDVTFRVTDYLRYASEQTKRLPGGDRLDPAVAVRLSNDEGRTQDVQLLAFDPANRSVGGGVLNFIWLSSESDLDAMREARPPTLRISVRDEDVSIDAPITVVGGDDLTVPFTPVGSSGYAYRVTSFQDDLNIDGRVVSLAIVEIRKGSESFVRWVFDDPVLTRDLHGEDRLSDHPTESIIDDNIQMSYLPGQRAALYVVGGPGENDLRLLRPDPADEASGRMVLTPVTIGEPIALRPDVGFSVQQFSPRSREETRPLIIPRAQRNASVGVRASMIRVDVPGGGNADSVWLPHHEYPFARSEDVLSRYPYRPTRIQMADGRTIEMMLSRERRKLPAPIVLDDFRLRTHIGGYSGSNASVRNWTSAVRFQTDDGWSEIEEVSVNAPREHEGYWFFQSFWDPPAAARADAPASAGLNYTVLGVGNREGVLVQLGGCILSVMGMIYAFYIKPMIKRRRQDRVYRAAAGQTPARRVDADAPAVAPVSVGAPRAFEEEGAA